MRSSTCLCYRSCRAVSVRVDTFGTSNVNETDIENAVTQNLI